VQYRSRFGKFASTLAQLGPPAAGVPGPPGPAAADLISSSLASGERDQYRFVMTPTPAGYTLTAKPKFYNNSGRRSYYTDQTLAERWSMGAEGAKANSPEVK
jgi:type IV pilus assembly protein PilA